MLPFPRIRNTGSVLLGLLLLWLLTFLYHEHAVPLFAAHRCAWTSVTQHSHDEPQTNVLLVADPQLIDNHTYPGRSEPLLQLSKHTVDTYLRQNYKAIINRLQPHYVIFLGDYLDNGRSSTEEYYEREYLRFKKIFDRWPAYEMGKTWLTNLPGNHDIGFGDGVKSRERFASHFGSPNQIMLINGVDFVFLDTLSYSAEDATLNAEARQFVQDLPATTRPRVLLSHVPLYRDTESVSCGSLRENPKFFLHRGYQYQSALSPEVSKEILEKVGPRVIFSGDDHDYCDITHEPLAREITVKSISMAMGIKYPAVQLFSFSEQESQFSYDTHMCYLPTPYNNIIAYVIMSFFSAAVLLLWNYKSRSSRYNYTGLTVWDSNLDDDDAESNIFFQKAMSYLNYQDAPITSFAPSPPSCSGSVWSVVLKYMKRGISSGLIFAKKNAIPGFLKNCFILGLSAILLYNVCLLGT